MHLIRATLPFAAVAVLVTLPACTSETIDDQGATVTTSPSPITRPVGLVNFHENLLQPNLLEILVAACFPEVTDIVVTEDETTVTVEVMEFWTPPTTDVNGDVGVENDCQSAVKVELSTSLGDRELMDASGRLLPRDQERAVVSEQIFPTDFIGALTDSELVWDSDTRSSENVLGGPTSDVLVGPGSMVLDTGQRIEIEADTPAGNKCPEFAGDHRRSSKCVIIGTFKPGTTTASWFFTRRSAHPSGVIVGSLVDVDGRNAVTAIGADSYISIPIADNATFEGCPQGGSIDANSINLPKHPYYEVVVADQKVVSLLCIYGD